MKTITRGALAAALLLAAGSARAQDPAAKSATFAARQEFKVVIPAGAKKVRAWFAMPQTHDSAQTVTEFKVDCPIPHQVVKDSAGNESIYVEIVNPTAKEFSLVETFTIARREIRTALDPAKSGPLSDAEREKLKEHLASNRHVVVNDEIRALAKEICGDEKNVVVAARKIYDWVLANIEYWVKYPESKKASPVGSSEYCLASKTGNCTDFHSLWAALARAQGIPTRIVYGSFFKAELDGKDKDQSYHCWPEFYVPGAGWVPHDVAVADIFVGDFKTTPANDEKVRLTTADGYKGGDPAKVEYYFGNIDERRVVWSRGRDLAMNPKQDDGPVNALAKAYIEIDGKSVGEKAGDVLNWSRKLTFTEKKQE
jgi:transglutaminase-like putative cysteine protease